MQQSTVCELNMLKGVSRFILENTITPPIALVTDLSAEIATGITALETAAAAQIGGALESSGGVGTRRDRGKELRDYLKDIARIGRSLPRGAFPGVAEIFVLPQSNGYNTLLASATAMLAKATELQTEFVARGLSATFPADVAALMTALRAGTDVKIDGHQTQVEATSALRHKAAAAIDAAIQLDAIMRAHFRNDPIKLDLWASARHVQRPKRVKDEEIAPSGPGGDTDGSGGDTGGSSSGIVALTGGGEGSVVG